MSSGKWKSKPQWDNVSYPLGWLESKTDINTCCWGYGGTRTLIHCWWDWKMVQPLCKKHLAVSLRVEPRVIIWSAIPLLEIHEKWKLVHTMDLNSLRFSSRVNAIVLHNSQLVECLLQRLGYRVPSVICGGPTVNYTHMSHCEKGWEP